MACAVSLMWISMCTMGTVFFIPMRTIPTSFLQIYTRTEQYLYPGTGRPEETGKGSAKGTKLNIPLKPGAGDAQFLSAWPTVEAHIAKYEPEFILFQCG